MQVLEDAGVFADVTLGEYPLDLIPFDEDVVSLELDAAYKELLVDGDRSCLYDMAKALWRLQVSAIAVPLFRFWDAHMIQACASMQCNVSMQAIERGHPWHVSLLTLTGISKTTTTSRRTSVHENLHIYRLSLQCTTCLKLEQYK